jgi:hypothetical protein
MSDVTTIQWLDTLEVDSLKPCATVALFKRCPKGVWGDANKHADTCRKIN